MCIPYLYSSALHLLDVFVDEVRMTIKKQQPRLIKIKAMKKIEASISQVKYQEEIF